MNNIDKRFILTEKILLYALPSLAIAGLILPIFFKQTNLSLLGSYLAIPMILATIIYINKRQNPFKSICISNNLFPVILFFYFICLSISMIFLYIHEYRPLSYYLIIALMATFILLEILLFDISQKKSILILIQIMILILDILWGVTLNYNYYISRTDPIGHVWLIENLINNGYVTDVFGMYESFPLWHILCACISNISGIFDSAHKVMFFTNGIIYSFLTVTVYLLSLRILKKKKKALISSLFVSLYPSIINYGMASISRSVIPFFEVLLLLLLLNSEDSRKIFLAIVITSSIIIYHTASIPFILLLFMALFVLQKIYNVGKNSKLLTPNYLFLSIALTLSYWLYHAEVLFKALINNIIISAPSGILTKSIIYTPLNELFNYLQYSPLLFFVIIGVLLALKSDKISGFGKIFCIFGLLAIAFSFPGPALLLNKLAGDMNIGRFEQYTFLFISLTGALGFVEIFSRSNKNIKFFVIVLFISMAFLSMSNDFNASDNPLVKRPFYTSYLTEEEIKAFNYAGTVSKGYVMSDYVTSRYLAFSPYNSKSHILEIDKMNMRFLRNSIDDVILIRNKELTKRPLKFYSSEKEIFELNPSWAGSLDYYYRDLMLWNELEKYNKVYNSNSVNIFN